MYTLACAALTLPPPLPTHRSHTTDATGHTLPTHRRGPILYESVPATPLASSPFTVPSSRPYRRKSGQIHPARPTMINVPAPPATAETVGPNPRSSDLLNRCA